MSLFDDKSCGCGQPPHPVLPDIPAGLPTLPLRQSDGFMGYREAMLSQIPTQPALQGWRARGSFDLGVMLLESWAYVLDVTGFYDARVAERAYIGTAPDALSAQRLADLLGYQPRGAMAATVRVAIQVDGADPVSVPKGTGFRSGAFDGNPPQVFEADADSTAWPQRNGWTLAPVRNTGFDGRLRFAARAAPPAGAVILVTDGGSQTAAARVVSVAPETGQDGERYQTVQLSGDGVSSLSVADVSTLSVSILRLALSPTPYGTAYDAAGGTLILDSLYSQLQVPSAAAVEIDGQFTPVQITATNPTTVTVTTSSSGSGSGSGSSSPPPPILAVTKVTISPAPSLPQGHSLTLHAGPVAAGSPISPASMTVGSSDIAGDGTLVSPIPPLGDAPASGTVILTGQRDAGAAIDGTVLEDGSGGARFAVATGADPIDPPLVPPVDLLGNVVLAVRGETVADETLGSADESKPFNSFTLAKKPLVWREDSSQPLGRRPDLVVRVDGIAWTRVDTLFGQKPDAKVYIVRQQPDGTGLIGFGDGKRGARPQSGVGNVHASYRFGAGAATPPPGSISQFVRMAPGLKSVSGPLAASGGADSETADDLKTAAPASALTIGRAVSLDDFEALALSYPGILNAAAGWYWDEEHQRAAAKIWIIAAGADPSDDLQLWLAGQAATDMVVTVDEATAAPFSALAVALGIAPDHDAATVRAAAHDALFDDATGFLSPRRQTIGLPLFRSALVAAIHAVPGVVAVTSITFDGEEMKRAVDPGAGGWFDLSAGASIS